MTKFNTVENKKLQIEKMLFGGSLGNDAICVLKELQSGPYQVYLLGGAVRDALDNNNPRDLDIMLDGQDEDYFKSVIKSNRVSYTRNAFNGYKLEFDIISIDVWFMKDHYVFKNKIYKKRKANIPKSTFINYDSLFYDLKKKSLSLKNYEDCIGNRLIDFVGKSEVADDNPNPIMSLIKLLEIRWEKGYSFSPSIEDYIAKLYFSRGEEIWNIIKTEYCRHYKKDITEEMMHYFEDSVRKEVIESFNRNNNKICGKGQYSIFDFDDKFLSVQQ